jgi:hypothetical protein
VPDGLRDFRMILICTASATPASTFPCNTRNMLPSCAILCHRCSAGSDARY